MSKALENQPAEFFNKPESTPQTKPVLWGEYILNGEAHDTLYYVDKNNPLGSQPLNPESDSQFWNWELPVRVWWQQLPG
jgi:hypothetical protein